MQHPVAPARAPGRPAVAAAPKPPSAFLISRQRWIASQLQMAMVWYGCRGRSSPGDPEAQAVAAQWLFELCPAMVSLATGLRDFGGEAAKAYLQIRANVDRLTRPAEAASARTEIVPMLDALRQKARAEEARGQALSASVTQFVNRSAEVRKRWPDCPAGDRIREVTETFERFDGIWRALASDLGELASDTAAIPAQVAALRDTAESLDELSAKLAQQLSQQDAVLLDLSLEAAAAEWSNVAGEATAFVAHAWQIARAPTYRFARRPSPEEEASQRAWCEKHEDLNARAAPMCLAPPGGDRPGFWSYPRRDDPDQKWYRIDVDGGQVLVSRRYLAPSLWESYFGCCLTANRTNDDFSDDVLSLDPLDTDRAEQIWRFEPASGDDQRIVSTWDSKHLAAFTHLGYDRDPSRVDECARSAVRVVSGTDSEGLGSFQVELADPAPSGSYLPD